MKVIMNASSQDKFGNQCWYDDNGLFHREDGPALIRTNGAEKWFFHGKLHRVDGPAKTTPKTHKGQFWGMEKWFLNGKPHRDNGPAVTLGDGTQKWFKNGILHREDGPAVKYSNGDNEYWINGVLHRIDGPAIETRAIDAWLSTGKLHREDGAALHRKIITEEERKHAKVYNYYLYFKKFSNFLLEAEDGERQWWQDGFLHRDNGPAIERTDGTMKWFQKGRLHRKDAAAVEYPGGSKEWWKNGRLHRIEGPAVDVADNHFIFHVGKQGITRYSVTDTKELLQRAAAIERPMSALNDKTVNSYTKGGEKTFYDTYHYKNRGECHFGKEWWQKGRLIKKEA